MRGQNVDGKGISDRVPAVVNDIGGKIVSTRGSAALVGLLALLALVIGAGCGGGDDEESSLTKAEFVKQADAICARQDDAKNKALEEAFREQGDKNLKGQKAQEAQEEIIADAALPPIDQMVEELADLGAPSGEEEKAEAMVEAFEEEVGNIEGDLKGTVEGKVGLFDKANKLAQELGLKSCSQI
jgi:hypothetical protein